MKKKPITPIIVAFEGLDCCYKETNSKALKEYLTKNGHTVVIRHFPRYESPAGVYAKRYLEGKYNSAFKSTSPISKDDELELVSSFYLMDMYDWYSLFISAFNCKEQSPIVILDRWFYSMIYYLTKRINLSSDVTMKDRLGYSDKVFHMATERYLLPKADILIKMENNSIEQIETISKKRNCAQDIYEKDADFLAEVKKNYDSIDFSKYVSDRFKNSLLTIEVSNKDRETIINEIINSKEIEEIESAT